MTLEVQAEVIGGREYYTIQQMAALTRKSDQWIYALIKTGNAIRRMKCLRIAGRVLVPAEEYTEFPFTYAGPNREDSVYHYNISGEIVNAETNSNSA